MVTLRRTVRFCVNPISGGGDTSLSAPRPGSSPNGFAGVPAMTGLGRYFELDLVCRGEAEPTTGYLINIKDIDRAARGTTIPRIAAACHESPNAEPASLLPELFRITAGALPAPLATLRWRLTPTYSVEMDAGNTTKAVMRQRFDFAAAHRLHVPALSDEENRRVFGRCNNPSGHGHNYMVEPAVEIDASSAGKNTYSLASLEATTHRALIDPFDHKHLNKDTPQFADAQGDNPSVENIARVFFEILSAAVETDSQGKAKLRSITVWETDRTSCTYPG